jgi:hypothetical protein
MERPLSGDEILRRFLVGGFEELGGAQSQELADYLEQRATASGLAAPMFLAQAIREVDRLLREHDEYGGTQVNFLRWVDRLVLG